MEELHKEKVLDSLVTVGWLDKNLKEYAGIPETPDAPKIKKLTGKRFGETQGFFSFIAKISLEWTSVNPKLPTQMILKLPVLGNLGEMAASAGVEQEEGSNWVAHSHNMECTFYDLWKTEECPAAVPKCFLTLKFSDSNNQGALGLEDLSKEGTTPSFVEGLNMAQVEALVKEVAKYHAWSLKKPEQILPLFETNVMPRKDVANMCGLFYKSAMDMKKDFPILDTPAMQEIMEYYKDPDNFHYVWSAHKELNLPPALCHWDTWPNNLIYKRVPGSTGNEKAGDELLGILDWAMCHPGFPLEDLARCFFGLVQTRARLQEDSVLKTYYESLCEACAPEKPPYSFEDVQRGFRYVTKWGVLFGLANLSMMWARDQSNLGKKDDPIVVHLMERLKRMLEDYVEILRDIKVKPHPLP